MVDKEIIEDAVEMTKDIPANDVLVPLQLEETELAPYPKIEYKIIEATSIDKVVRDVNTQLENWRQTEWGIAVINWPVTKFYQTMIRWNVDSGERVLDIPWLEDEEDLYEDVEWDVANW